MTQTQFTSTKDELVARFIPFLQEVQLPEIAHGFSELE